METPEGLPAEVREQNLEGRVALSLSEDRQSKNIPDRRTSTRKQKAARLGKTCCVWKTFKLAKRLPKSLSDGQGGADGPDHSLTG